VIQPTTTDLVRDLLTTAATDVGWEVDLDQLPVTAAHTPTLVINLIEASAAYLAALATTRILDNAAESLRTVMDGAADADLDWEARLLTAVLDLTDLRGQDTGRTRRRLLAALHALHPEGATWPPPPPTDATDLTGESTARPADPTGNEPAGLAATLAQVGLRPVAAASDPTHITYAAEHGERRVTVTVHPDDDNTAEAHLFDGHAVAWSVSFSPGTPPDVIAGALRGAVSDPDP
jgi:hypothetical protein